MQNIFSKQTRHFIALFVLILYIFASFLSIAYIVKEADHDCTGANCEVCEMIAQAEQTLKTLGSGLILISIAVPFIMLQCKCETVSFVDYLSATLVSWKVRLND